MQKIEAILELDEYRSYRQIYSPKIEESQFGGVSIFDHFFSVYKALVSPEYSLIISIGKYMKLVDWFRGFGKHKLKKLDLELEYKKLQSQRGSMNLLLFNESLLNLIERYYTGEETSLLGKAELFVKINRHKLQV